VAAGMGSGYNLGAIGGYENITLTVAQMPSHKHNTYVDLGSAQGGNQYYPDWQRGDMVWNVGTYAGGGLSHSNMPPYLVLNSIIFAGK